MMDKRNAISKPQLFYLVTQTQVGIGIMSLPHDVYQYARGDAWLSVLIAGVVTQCMLFLYWLLCVKLPSRDFFQMATYLWGKLPGVLVAFFYAVYFILASATIINTFSEVVAKWILPLTPKWVVFLVALTAGVYLAAGSLAAIARFYAVAMFNLALLVILLLLGLGDLDIRYLLPVGESGASGVLQGMTETLYSFHGYEVLLFFFPFVTRIAKKKELLLTASAANACTTLVYVFVVLICTTYFSPGEIRYLQEPVLFLLRSYSIVLIERVDLVFLAVWMVTVATSYGTYLYLSASGLTGLFRPRGKAGVPFLLLAAGVCFAFSFLPQSMQAQVEDFGSWLDIAGLVIIPFLALLTAFLTRSGRQSQ